MVILAGVVLTFLILLILYLLKLGQLLLSNKFKVCIVSNMISKGLSMRFPNIPFSILSAD